VTLGRAPPGGDVHALPDVVPADRGQRRPGGHERQHLLLERVHVFQQLHGAALVGAAPGGSPASAATRSCSGGWVS